MRWPRCGFAGVVAVLVACGGSTNDESSGAVPDDSTPEPPASEEPGDEAAMSIAMICDPVEATAADWLGADFETAHLDLGVDDPDFPVLVCEWVRRPDYREIRIVTHGSPDVWTATLATEGEPLDGVSADSHLHDGTLSVHASNGWTVDVNLYEGDPPDRVVDGAVLATLANDTLTSIG